MKNLVLLMCTMLLALACGAESYDPELEERGQNIYAENGFGWEFGVNSGRRCDPNRTLLCFLPRNKYIHIWVDESQMTPSQRDRTNAAAVAWAHALDDQIGHLGYDWRVTNVPDNNADVRIVGKPGDVHRVRDNNRHNYVRLTCTNQSNPLPEAEFIGAPGEYRHCKQMKAEIDFFNVDSKANSLNVPQATLLADTVGFVVAVAGGAGGDIDPLVINSLFVEPVDKFEGLGPRDVCRAGAFDPTAGPLAVFTIACP